MKKIILYTIFSVVWTLSSTSLYAQKVISTASGQVLLIGNGGTWERMQIDPADTLGLNPDHKIITLSEQITPEQNDDINAFLNNLLDVEAMSRVQMESIYDELQILELEKDKASENGDNGRSDGLNESIRIQKNNLKVYEDIQNISAKLIKKGKKLKNKGSRKWDKALTKLKTTANDKLQTNFDTEVITSTPEEVVVVDEPISTSSDVQEVNVPENKPKAKKRKRKKYSKQSYPRGIAECEIMFDGKDEKLRKKRKTTAFQPLWQYTHPNTKKYFKSQNFMEAYSSLDKVGRKYYLNLKIRLNSKDAAKSYGYINKNDIIRFQLVDGRKVLGTAILPIESETEPYTGATIYNAVYSIEKDDLEILSKKELDNIGIIWSSGYEEYTIYDVDALRNQVKCLLD